MRICHIFQYYYPIGGGIQSYIRELSNYMKNKFNTKSYLITLNYFGMEKYEKIGNLTVLREGYYPFPFLVNLFPSNKLNEIFNYVMRRIQCKCFQIHKFPSLKKRKIFDIIICHDILQIDLAIKLSKLQKIPLVLQIHTGPKLLHMNKKKIKIIKKNVKAIISNRFQTFSILKKIFPSKQIYLFENFINLSNNNYKIKTNNSKNLLFIGRLEKWKNPTILFKEFNKIKNKIHDLNMIIVGDGPLKNQLQRIALKNNFINRVSFLGHVPSVWSNDYGKAIFFALSPYYNYPSLSLMEAMANKYPVIASNMNETDILVKHEKNGFLIDLKEPNQISNAILKIFDNKETYNKMGMQSYEIIQKYSTDKIIPQIYFLFQSLVRNYYLP